MNTKNDIKQVELLKNFDCEFTFNEVVLIQKGFYKNSYGIIKKFNEDNITYIVEIGKDNNKKFVICNDDDIRHTKSLFKLKW